VKNKNTYSLLFLLTIPIVFLLWFFWNRSEKKPLRALPFFGPKQSLKINDTIYHQIADFKFINQDGDTITSNFTEGKIYVTDYFFTTCKSICPIMSNRLKTVYETFRNEPSFLILSHTVDPETDSSAQLKSYANNHGVNDKRWQFLTGPKKELYELARKSYLLNAEEGNGGEEDFIHTQNFALIDKEKHIRGFYDGTDSADVERLKVDIKLLLQAYAFEKK
jgi:protein SCO1